MAGGEPGALGENLVERADGTVERLGGAATTEVGPDDVLVLRTPGGGGYGPPPDEGRGSWPDEEEDREPSPGKE